MKIEPNMRLDELVEKLWVNGDSPDNAEQIAESFRKALIMNAPYYGWTKTADVEDVDWFRMRTEAIDRYANS